MSAFNARLGSKVVRSDQVVAVGFVVSLVILASPQRFDFASIKALDSIVGGCTRCARFLIEMLSGTDSEEVTLELSTPTKAGLIKPVDQDENEDLLMLAMPLMSN